MAGPLAEIYSASDTFKRKLVDALRNPKAKLEQVLGDANDRARDWNEADNAALDEVMATGKLTGPKMMGQAMALAQGYNPAGIFIGPESKLWNGNNAFRAANMAAKGGDPKEIWIKTGTFKGPDGIWRQEIDDSGSKFVGSEGIAAKAEALRNRNAELKQTIKDTQGHPDLFPKELTAARRPLRDEIKQNQRKLDNYFGPSQFPGAGNYAPYAYEHDALYKAYPDLESVVVRQGRGSPDYLGSYEGNASRGSGALDVTAAGLKKDPRSTTTHEMQHAVQDLEGFPMGGNQDSARFQMQSVRNAELQPFRAGNAMWEGALGDLGKANTALYAEKLRELTTKPNITPSQITNMSAWYEHSDAIRSELGAMPKKSGPEQKEWLRNAAQILSQKEFNRGRFREIDAQPRDYWEALRRKANRQMDKHQQDARQHGEISSKYKRLEAMSDFDLYQRLGGEAEARAVQKRLDYTPEQRANTFPLDDYDVPLGDLIFYAKEMK